MRIHLCPSADFTQVAVGLSGTINGRMLWVPPNGTPYWTDKQPVEYLTPEEIRKYLCQEETENGQTDVQ